MLLRSQPFGMIPATIDYFRISRTLSDVPGSEVIVPSWTSEHPTATFVIGALSTISSALSAYHGYKRNDSVGWALWWGLMGSIAPVITPTIAFAQGFGQPRRGR